MAEGGGGVGGGCTYGCHGGRSYSCLTNGISMLSTHTQTNKQTNNKYHYSDLHMQRLADNDRSTWDKAADVLEMVVAQMVSKIK